MTLIASKLGIAAAAATSGTLFYKPCNCQILKIICMWNYLDESLTSYMWEILSFGNCWTNGVFLIANRQRHRLWLPCFAHFLSQWFSPSLFLFFANNINFTITIAIAMQQIVDELQKPMTMKLKTTLPDKRLLNFSWNQIVKWISRWYLLNGQDGFHEVQLNQITPSQVFLSNLKL